MLPLVDRFGLRRLDADAVEADVHADPVEPRRQRRAAAKTAKTAIRTQEHVLRQVACVLATRNEAVTELIHGPPVPLDDDVERLKAAGKTGFDQRCFV